MCCAEKCADCGAYPNGGSPFPYYGNGSLHSFPPVINYNYCWAALFAYADLHGDPTKWDAKFQIGAYPFLTNCDPSQAQSPHAAMNVGMGDGSVRTLDDTIDISIWRALLTPNGAEIVSDAL